MLRRKMNRASLRHDGMISTQMTGSMDDGDLFGASLTVARTLIVATVVLLTIAAARATELLEFKIGYLRLEKPRAAISLVQVPAENNGVAGAQAAINDNNTTGKFLDQHFTLDDVKLKEGEDPAAAAAALADRGVSIVLADLPADALLRRRRCRARARTGLLQRRRTG